MFTVNRIMKTQKGFSLIETMVALLIICIGILGLVALQGRAVQYANENAQRNNAAMLANDLIELMRSNRSALIDGDGLLRNASSYYKAAGSSFPTAQTTACLDGTGCTADQMATTQLAQWTQQVRNSLPLDSTLSLLKNQYVICRTDNPSDEDAPCSGTGSSVLIQIAWLGKDTCPSGENCTALDSNRREFYRVSFQP
ncbi:hypothetical protein AOX63_21260 [Pseudomonas sp. ADP]|nr:hypothetical protein AOX63_21260 [Pseudomonas sp. ADP]OBP10934.1 type IV pilus modification protein PilV [Pseudomonas sp. EGD-AKN5]